MIDKDEEGRDELMIALQNACKFGHFEVVRYLIENHENLIGDGGGGNKNKNANDYLENNKTTTSTRSTSGGSPSPPSSSPSPSSPPLVKAVEGEHLDAVKYLIENSGAGRTLKISSSKRGGRENNDGNDDNNNAATTTIATNNKKTCEEKLGFLPIVKLVLNISNNHNNSDYTTTPSNPGQQYFIERNFERYFWELLSTRNSRLGFLLYISIFYENFEIAKYLICEQGANIESTTTIHRAAGTEEKVTLFCLFCSLNHLKAARFLLDMGANIHSTTTAATTTITDTNEHDGSNVMSFLRGETLFHTACVVGNLHLVRFLCEEGDGVNVEAKTTESDGGRVPLHYAVEYEQSHIVEYLLKERGANVNACDNFGMTPLHILCAKSVAMESIEILLGLSGGWGSATTLAVLDGVSNTTKFTSSLLVSGNSKAALSFACFRNRQGRNDTAREAIRLRIVNELLITNGADMFATNHDGSTPLHLALLHRSEAIVEAIIQAGGPELLHIPNIRGEYPASSGKISDDKTLMVVRQCPIMIHALPVSKLAWLHQTNPNIFSRITSMDTGNMPIHDACVYGCREGVIPYMAEKYAAGLYQSNKIGRYPIEIAIESICKKSDAISLDDLYTILRGAPTLLKDMVDEL